MSLLRAHIDQKFPRFVYHDGVFESLDDRVTAKSPDGAIFPVKGLA
jgi:uncharacterized protein YydD (DUF2326 family)